MKKPIIDQTDRFCIINIPNCTQSKIILFRIAVYKLERDILKHIKRIV